jgi:acyl carrier protein
MDREEILSQVQDIFRVILNSESINLNDGTTANDVEGWDSLTHVQLISEIEKHFNIRFSLKEMLSWKTIGKMIDCIEKKVN